MTNPSDSPIQATLTLAEGCDVLGYVSQCELCGQRAITLSAHGPDWVCPRCAEVVDAEIACGRPVGDRDCALRDGHTGRCLPAARRGEPGWGEDCLCPPTTIGSAIPCPIHAPGMSMITWMADYPNRVIRNTGPLPTPALLDDDGPDLRKIQG